MEIADKLDKIEEIMSRAENRVLFPDAVKGLVAKLCGEEIILRPLPLKWAKQLSTRLQTVMRGFVGEGDKKFAENADMEVANSLRDCLIIMADFYSLEGVDEESIESAMSLVEIKSLVLAQAKINEEDDFLLMPLQAIIGVLSKATAAAKDVRDHVETTGLKETLSGMQDSLKNTEQALQS